MSTTIPGAHQFTASATQAQTIRITIYVKNYGLGVQRSTPVYFTINGGNRVDENYTAYLLSGASGYYQFTTAVDLSEPGTYVIQAGTVLSNDENPNNDYSVYTFTTVTNPPTTLPFFEGFENTILNATTGNERFVATNVCRRPRVGSNHWCASS